MVKTNRENYNIFSRSTCFFPDILRLEVFFKMLFLNIKVRIENTTSLLS